MPFNVIIAADPSQPFYDKRSTQFIALICAKVEGSLGFRNNLWSHDQSEVRIDRIPVTARLK